MCDHLTNFAALYSPYQNKPLPEAEGLNIVTYICCGLSIFGLVVTISVHLAVPRLGKSAQKRILVNLCFAILGRDISMILVGATFTGELSAKCRETVTNSTQTTPEDFIKLYHQVVEQVCRK